MEQALADALAEVKAAFSHRPRPRSVPHCQMCYRDEEVARFLARPASVMSAEDLQPLLWDAYVCWGTWREFAHYVPRLLELYAEGVLPDDEELYARLMVPARPELAKYEYDGERMSPEERQSIFKFVQAVLLSRLQESVEHDRVWIMAETLGFLAALDVPLAPFLHHLLNSPSAQVRANVCVFMAENAWERQPVENMRLTELTPLPENQAVLDEFFALDSMASFLLEHLSDVKMFSLDSEALVGWAFDWATSQPQVPEL